MKKMKIHPYQSPTTHSLCGKKIRYALDFDDEGKRHAFASFEDLTGPRPLKESEYFCKECSKHPDFPLLLLGGI